MKIAASKVASTPAIIVNGRGHERTMRMSGGNCSISRFSPLPWESATTISVAPASFAAVTAAIASRVMNSRKRPYSNPVGPS